MVEISAEGGIPTAIRERPRVLIEEWLPIEALGVEARRERGASSSLPPLYFLHVWWARRPLIVSRAAVLASLLSAGFPKREFLKIMGILGDPVAARKLLDDIAAGRVQDFAGNKYGYKRAFTYTPSESDRKIIEDDIQKTWGTNPATVLDSFAGGGSIPFEAYRFGLA